MGLDIEESEERSNTIVPLESTHSFTLSDVEKMWDWCKDAHYNGLMVKEELLTGDSKIKDVVN